MTVDQHAKRPGRMILLPVALLALLVCGLLLWRMSVPWRLLSQVTPAESTWSFNGHSLQMQPIRWTDGSLILIASAADAEFRWLDLLREGSVNLLRLVKARIEFDEAPGRFQNIDFSSWKDLLTPEVLPVDKVDLTGARLKLSIFPSPLDTDLTAIRNRSGAIDSTARVSGDGLSVQGFLRLGWDSLENGGSFEGSYQRQEGGYFFSFFDEQPFRSLLDPFRGIQFEGSFVLDKDWRFNQGVRLITAAEPRAVFHNTALTELAFSGATAFPDPLMRENRAILEGLFADGITLFRLEARRRGEGPIIIEITLNGERAYEMDADSWQDGSPARLRQPAQNLSTPGVLVKSPKGGLAFLAEGVLPSSKPLFALPGVLAIHTETNHDFSKSSESDP